MLLSLTALSVFHRHNINEVVGENINAKLQSANNINVLERISDVTHLKGFIHL